MPHASYLENAVDMEKRNVTVLTVAAMILNDKSKGIPIQAIAVQGVSGLLVAPIVSYLTHVPLVVVRKCSDSSNHSSYRVEHDYSFDHYVVIDDCVCSGNTLLHIIQELRYYASNPTLEKVYLYGEFGNSDTDVKAINMGVRFAYTQDPHREYCGGR